MTFYITKNKRGATHQFSKPPKYAKAHDAWVAVGQMPLYLSDNKDTFPEVTFENSPFEYTIDFTNATITIKEWHSPENK